MVKKIQSRKTHESWFLRCIFCAGMGQAGTVCAILKDMIFPVMDEIRKVVLTAPVKAGTIVLHKVCGLDSDVMVTKNVVAR